MHGLAEQRARGIRVASRKDQHAEIVEHSEVGRRSPQEFEVVTLRRLEDA